MHKTTSFKKKILAVSIASLAGISVSALAQSTDTVEEVVVTGIKASLTKAMDIKREAAGVVDAISAEDIGKMPDANLAESLQRISGVSIDRSNGEGSKVTVRGLAGDYNLVTLNGRQMPASSQGNAVVSTSRSFDFANLASEGVAGVEVYKTGRADIASGGMGAVINILTPHPLSTPGLKATVGIKAVSDTSAESSKMTPEISGLFSDTFADDTIGVAVTGSYQERESGSAQAFSGGYFNHIGDSAGDWTGIPITGPATIGPDPSNPYQTNLPTTTQLYSTPINFGYRITEDKRTRTNGSLALQYKPVDTLTVGLDYTFARQDVDSEAHSISTWFNRGQPLKINWGGDKTGAKYPLTYSETNAQPKDLAMDAQLTGTRNDLNSLGINVKFDVTDHLKLEFDGHNSISDSKPNSPYGVNNSLTVQANTNYNPSVDYSKELPVLHVNYPVAAIPGHPEIVPPVIVSPTAAQMQLTGSTFRNARQKSEVDQYKLKGSYSFDESVLKAVNFGIESSEINNHSQYVTSDLQNHGNWAGVGHAGDLDASLWPTDKLSNYFDNDGIKDPRLQNSFMKFDLDKVAKAAAAKVYSRPIIGNGTKENPQFPQQGYSSATVTNNSPCAMGYCAPTEYTNKGSVTLSAPAPDGDLIFGGQTATDLQTVETTLAGYVQANFTMDYDGRAAHILTGLRYETTDVESTSLLPVNGDASWITDNEFTIASTDNSSFFTETATYNKLLPSFDYDVEVADDVKFRASYSKTMARPNYDQIKGGVQVSGVRVGGGTASAGNPSLKPLESTNLDASIEWYYDEASYVSGGYFVKKLHDFIGEGQRIVGSEMHTPVGGARYQAAVAAGAVGSTAIRNYIKTNYPDTVSGNTIFAVAGDPTVDVTVTSPINSQNVLVHGFELAVQHTFSDTGFGVLANLTKADSNVGYENASMDPQFAFLGLSDSYNFVIFYDKDSLQGRIAYNWRDEFLSRIDGNQGRNPVYVEAYGQVDASLSYEFTENLTVSFEGLNLTNEHTRSHGRDWHELFNYTETGPRYNIGARYKF